MFKDDVVVPTKQKAVEEFYKNFHANLTIDSLDIDHSLPRAYLQEPGGNNFDLSYHMLKHLLGHDLKPYAKDYQDGGVLTRFYQDHFVDVSLVPDHKMETAGFQPLGYIFVPYSCQKKMCDLHVSLHGWQAGNIRWVENDTNIIHYAATNDLIVLYPVATASWYTGQRKDDHPEWTKLHTK